MGPLMPGWEIPSVTPYVRPQVEVAAMFEELLGLVCGVLVDADRLAFVDASGRDTLEAS